MTYYEILGVDPEAPKDAIKEAYKAELDRADAQVDTAASSRKGPSERILSEARERKAEIKTAWQVLADPIQRARYDSTLEVGDGSDASDDGDGDSDGDGDGRDRTPARTGVLTGARRARSNLSGRSPAARASRTGAGDKAGTAARPARGTPKQPTIVLPPGMRLAEPRIRGLALSVDVAILVLLSVLVSVVSQPVLKARYPHQIDKINALTKSVDKHKKAESAASSAASKADKAAKAAAAKGDSAGADAQKAKAIAELGTEANQKAQAAADQKKLNSENKKFAPVNYLIMAATVLLMLGYLVPSTALTGQTLGKRIRHIKVVRMDGEPVGWAGSLNRFLLPVLLAVAIPSLGVVLGLGMVLWWVWDANRQGLHDKMARTIVVDVPGAYGA